jgi:enoyl-CoA hydratase/carnithine racemase
VGIQTALEWCYTGRVFPAAEAHEKGLVRSLHEPGQDLIPAARALAREIIDNTAPVSIALTRQMIWRMAGADHPMQAHRADSRAFRPAGLRPTPAKGVTSFLEKRAPALSRQSVSAGPARTSGPTGRRRPSAESGRGEE